ncbi:hypothetical protein QBC33DRAFT_548713 [Phialemonium atrogriseum]|uniref:Uncharacterized protein n=1 Tax=Phialemonium atrogriseum TaxID=1093897 RepID=A0AAJ0BVH7_9PEZI|nr:uncharacterized protein QBC33DRAFT_548713 [Phialemonium atrogriseum]KAK1763834.1 hypothetical protein QBC33DRAFT_548713 [Phialemonium atrogriseum]
MAAQERKIDLQDIKNGGLSDTELPLFRALDSALNSADAVESSAAEAASSICGFLPASASTDDVEEFLWTFWGLLIQVSRAVPHDHAGQQILVNIVKDLHGKDPAATVKIWAAKTSLWKDLPLLGPCMREAWFDPTSKVQSLDAKANQEWVNQNSFASRLFGARLTSWPILGLWQLRASLEEPGSGPALDSRVSATCEWVVHAGRLLLGECRADAALDQAEARAQRPGSLYEGKAGFNMDRWGFWKRRFAELGAEDGINAEVKDLARSATETMEALEAGT